MRRVHYLIAAAISAPFLAPGAQVVRWNDRPTTTWQDEPPRVRVEIAGARSVAPGSPVLVKFELSDDAYVVVGRVDGSGRLTILYPERPRDRPAVKGNQLHYVRSTRMGLEASFIATDRTRGGYVFAVASFVPMDLSMLENRDFERFGAYSRYTLVNREYAQQPDTYIARFASSILWDPDTPYDYDIDYYTPDGAAMAAGYASWPMCSSLYRHFNGFGPGYRLTYALYDWDMWDWWGGALSPLAACGTYYNTLRCISVISAFGVPCAPYGGTIAVLPPVVAGPVTEGTPVPNEGVVRGGLDTPTPLPVPVATGGGDPPPLERRAATFDQALRTPAGSPEWESYLSIPQRATRKLKAGEASVKDARGSTSGRAASDGATPGFDRAVVAPKGDKSRVAEAPPSRVTPARETLADKTRSGSNRGTGNVGSSPSSPGSMTGGISRPVGSSTRTGTTSSRPTSTPTMSTPTSGTTKSKPPATTSGKTKPPPER